MNQVTKIKLHFGHFSNSWEKEVNNMQNNNETYSERLLGLDLLRGLCALSVALYHLTSWRQLASLYSAGTFGVYIFFVISACSMAIAYENRLSNRESLLKYLAIRYARILPLFTLVLFASVNVFEDFRLTLINMSLLFGFANPGATSLVIGGWSLGIEFIFYLLFPLLICLPKTLKASIIIFCFSLLVQFLSVSLTINQPTDLSKKWNSYIQFSSFIGFFIGGMYIPTWLQWLKTNKKRIIQKVSAIVGIISFLLILSLNGSYIEENLIGVRYLFITLLCFICVIGFGIARIPKRLHSFANFMGNTSFGVYLLHPLISKRIRGKSEYYGELYQWLLIFVIIALTYLFAYLIDRYLEKPILKFVKRSLHSTKVSLILPSDPKPTVDSRLTKKN